MLEIRHLTTELRTDNTPGGPPKVSGYFAIWDDPATIRDARGKTFREVVRKGALSPALARGDNIRAYERHDYSRPPLGRSDKGTVSIREDNRGAWIDLTLPDTTAARDLVANVRHGNYSGWSWGADPRRSASTMRDKWTKATDGTLTREIFELPIFEVSLASDPAYGNTTVELREEGLILPDVEDVLRLMELEEFIA